MSDPFSEYRARLQVVRASAFLAEPESGEAEDLVAGLLPAEGVNFLAGEPGTWKTMCALQLCASVKHGIPFLGRAVRQMSVLYVGYEGTASAVRRRMRGQAEGMGIRELEYHVAFKQDFALDDHTFDALLHEVSLLAPCFVVVDPYAQAHSLDEVRDALQLLAALRRLEKAARGPVLLVHHLTKAGGALSKRLRGHGSYLAAADVVLALERAQGGRGLTLGVVKARDFAPARPVRLRFDPTTFLLERVALTLRDHIIDELTATTPGDRRAITKRLVEQTLKTRQAINDAWRELIEAGQVVEGADDPNIVWLVDKASGNRARSPNRDD